MRYAISSGTKPSVDMVPPGIVVTALYKGFLLPTEHSLDNIRVVKVCDEAGQPLHGFECEYGPSLDGMKLFLTKINEKGGTMFGGDVGKDKQGNLYLTVFDGSPIAIVHIALGMHTIDLVETVEKAAAEGRGAEIADVLATTIGECVIENRMKGEKPFAHFVTESNKNFSTAVELLNERAQADLDAINPPIIHCLHRDRPRSCPVSLKEVRVVNAYKNSTVESPYTNPILFKTTYVPPVQELGEEFIEIDMFHEHQTRENPVRVASISRSCLNGVMQLIPRGNHVDVTAVAVAWRPAMLPASISASGLNTSTSAPNSDRPVMGDQTHAPAVKETDLSRFEALYQSVGQRYERYVGHEIREEDIGMWLTRHPHNGSPVHTVLKFKATIGTSGYGRFFTCLYFDERGQYLGIGAWE
jgi:hypothetical protein